jgi:hypothetical protein
MAGSRAAIVAVLQMRVAERAFQIVFIGLRKRIRGLKPNLVRGFSLLRQFAA